MKGYVEHATVLVVGAGPTGLTLACSLRNHGVEVRVADCAAGPATSSRALGLQPRGAEVLDRVGALADLADRAVKALTVHIHANGAELTLPIGRGSPDGRQTMFISQADIEAELRRRLMELGGKIEWNTELVGVEQDATGVVATIRDTGATGARREQELRCDWLIGADGAHSAVRELSGIGFPGTTLYDRMLLADVRVDWALDREGTTIWTRGGELFAVIPLPGSDQWRLFASIPEGFPEPASDHDVIAAFDPLLRRYVGTDGAALRSIGWTSVFRMNRRLADTYRKQRVLLGGDAAHIHSPLGGQGMNTGIADAENLAWKLAVVAAGAAGDGLLDSYEAERRPLAEDVLKTTTAAAVTILAPGVLARLRREALFRLMQRPAVQRRMWYSMSQLGVSYRGGPLACTRRLTVGGRRPRPGDRVPDVGCQSADGQSTRLYAELRGQWAVVCADNAEAERLAAAARARLGVAVVALRPRGGDPSGAWLVRPDGHLGWRGRDLEGMTSWLDTAILGRDRR